MNRDTDCLLGASTAGNGGDNTAKRMLDTLKGNGMTDSFWEDSSHSSTQRPSWTVTSKDPYGTSPLVDKTPRARPKDPLELSLSVLDQDFSKIVVNEEEKRQHTTMTGLHERSPFEPDEEAEEDPLPSLRRRVSPVRSKSSSKLSSGEKHTGKSKNRRGGSPRRAKSSSRLMDHPAQPSVSVVDQMPLRGVTQTQHQENNEKSPPKRTTSSRSPHRTRSPRRTPSSSPHRSGLLQDDSSGSATGGRTRCGASPRRTKSSHRGVSPKRTVTASSSSNPSSSAFMMMDNSSSKSQGGRMDNSSSANSHGGSSSGGRRCRSPRRTESNRKTRGLSPLGGMRRTQSLECKAKTGKDILQERHEQQLARQLQFQQQQLQQQHLQQQQLGYGDDDENPVSSTRNATWGSSSGGRQPSRVTRRARSMDLLKGMLTQSEPPALKMSGGEIAWKATPAPTKLEPVNEEERQRKKHGTINKARRLTKAMWGTRIQEARHNNHNKTAAPLAAAAK